MDTPAEGKLIHNPSTGEVAIWDGQNMQPLPGKLVTNEKTGQKALWDGKSLTPVNIQIDQSQPTAGADQALVNKMAGPAPEQPESLKDRILRYGRNAGAIALPTAGGLLGAAGGLATPVPGGALVGEMAGSAGGEYLSQKLGLSEPSTGQVVLAGAAPVGGRLLGAAAKALPISKAGAIKQIAKLLPAETSAALFAKAGSNALDQQALAPVAQKVIDASTKLGKNSPEFLNDMFDQVTSGKLSMEAAGALKDDIQGYINYYSHFGGSNYNPTIATELKTLRTALTDGIEAVNPGYKAALEASGREKNVGRLQTLISKSGDPAKSLSELRATPRSDLSPKNRLLMGGFDDAELNDIQHTLERLSKSVSLKQWVESRLGGAALGGALGYTQGGSKEALGGALLGSMLAYPIGRRMINEMVKSGSINNLSAVSTAAQVFRASVARLPKAAQAPEASQQPDTQ